MHGPRGAKLMSAAEAAALVRSGDHVFVGTACATPPALVVALEGLDPAPTRFRHRSFFVGSDTRSAMKQGMADDVPISIASIARVPQLMHIGRIRVDVALIQVSPPDEFGCASPDVSVDVIPAAVAKARLVIADVNPVMPRTMGDSTLHLDPIHALLAVDTPLIDIAHPDFRAGLFDQAEALGCLGEEQTLRHLGAYPVEEEHSVVLKDQRPLLLRPATSADGEHIRELFHGWMERDVDTRFFRRVRGLSNRDIQRLCNFSFDTEVAFVAEILAENVNMIRLARAGSDTVTVESEGSTVRVTQLF